MAGMGLVGLSLSLSLSHTHTFMSRHVNKGLLIGVGDGQGGLACCDSWGRKDSDTTE